MVLAFFYSPNGDLVGFLLILFSFLFFFFFVENVKTTINFTTKTLQTNVKINVIDGTSTR